MEFSARYRPGAGSGTLVSLTAAAHCWIGWPSKHELRGFPCRSDKYQANWIIMWRRGRILMSDWRQLADDSCATLRAMNFAHSGFCLGCVRLYNTTGAICCVVLIEHRGSLDYLFMPPRSAMFRRHIVISGPGRAGTSFLVQLLTHLGLDTGFRIDGLELSYPARAGLETDIRMPNAPYIVKSPWLCDYIDQVLTNPLIRIDHAILPLRDFAAAAASRAYVQKAATGSSDGEIEVPGGLWHVTQAAEQATVLRNQFTKLIEALARYDVPVTLLWYPRIVRDPGYIYEKLAFLLQAHDFTSFREVFERIQRPEFIHQFTADDI